MAEYSVDLRVTILLLCLLLFSSHSLLVDGILTLDGFLEEVNMIVESIQRDEEETHATQVQKNVKCHSVNKSLNLEKSRMKEVGEDEEEAMQNHDNDVKKKEKHLDHKIPQGNRNYQ